MGLLVGLWNNDILWVHFFGLPFRTILALSSLNCARNEMLPLARKSAHVKLSHLQSLLQLKRVLGFFCVFLRRGGVKRSDLIVMKEGAECFGWY